MRIDLENIEKFQDNKSIKSIAFALLIKEIYVSSAIKNYNPHSLQKKLSEKGFNFHHTTIKKYIENLMYHNIALIKDNCLIIVKLHTEKTVKIRIKKGYAKEFKDYVHFIRGGIIKRKIWLAEYVYTKRSLSTKLLNEPKTLKDFKSGKRLAKRWGVLGSDETEFNYKQSILSFCREFNCSVSELYTTLKFLSKKGWLIIKRNIKKICEDFGWKIDLPYFFIKDGFVFQVSCNSYLFNNIDSKK
ncbi:MAG: hypothetical protein WC389_15870 [Lutibacter sp.]|jgi:hypothetical protein